MRRLSEAHDAGLIHRDIKPANLLAAYRGGHYDVTKLLDFGLVKTLREDKSVHLSQEGTVAGSPLYMAPEQVMHNQPPDRPTDIYGWVPSPISCSPAGPRSWAKPAMEVMVAHARDPVIPPSDLQPDIPGDLEPSCSAASPRTRRSLSRHAEPRPGAAAVPTPRTGRPGMPRTGGGPI